MPGMLFCCKEKPNHQGLKFTFSFSYQMETRRKHWVTILNCVLDGFLILRYHKYGILVI